MIISQVTFEEIENIHFDGFIASSGFESRASFQALKYSGSALKKIAIGFENHKDDEARLENDKVFNNKGFQVIQLSENINYKNVIDEFIDEVVSQSKDTNLNIYIDYSSMIRNWYSYLLQRFYNLRSKPQINLTFAYSHATYEKSPEYQEYNRVIQPLEGYCNLTIPSKPTALIICLGNEPVRVIGLQEYFDATPYLFYSDESFNPDYCTEIELIYKALLAKIKPQQVYKFPITDMLYLNYMLENLCTTLINDYHIVIAPCGPKPFALISMINSLKFSESIEVWRISPDIYLSQLDRKPLGIISVIKVIIASN